MSQIIRDFLFNINFQEDKFERADGNTEVITIVENDNKSTKFEFNFEEEIQDGTNILVKIKHNIGFVKDYVLCIENKKAELILTNSIAVAGTLKMTISLVGENNEILTPTQFQNKILVKEAITGETPIPEDDSKLLEGLISQVNVLKSETQQTTEQAKEATAKVNEVIEDAKKAKSEIDESQNIIIQLQNKSKEIVDEYNNLVEQVKTVLSNITSRGHIYGIKRKIIDLNGNKNTSTTWTKIYDNEGLVANAQKGTDSNIRNDYDNLYPWNKIITLNYDTTNKKVNAYYGDDTFAWDGSNGEVLTRYPKFWIKRMFPIEEDDGFYEYRMIADFELQDFIEVKQFETGRYEMYVDENNIGHSFSGVYPKYNANIKQFMQYAKNTGEDFCIEDWRIFVEETLYLVEYADNNSQSVLGRGVSEWSEKKALVAEQNVNRIIVDNASAFPIGRSICIGTTGAWNGGVAANRTITSIEQYKQDEISGYAIYFDGEPVNIAVGNDIWGSAQKTGDCNSLGMKSGCLVNDGRHSVIYRGKENPFSNLFKFVIGINIKDYQSYVNYDPSTYTPDTFDSNYSKLSYANPNNQEGYIKVMGFDKNNPLIALPTELGAGSGTGYADYCYSKNAGNRVALVGGNFSDGAYAGFFSWYFGSDSSYSAWSIGARLLKYQ